METSQPKKWSIKDPEAYKRAKAKWYQDNRARIAAAAKARYLASKGVVLEPTIAGRFNAALKRMMDKAEASKERRRRWIRENRKRLNEYQREYYHRDVEASREYIRQKRQRDPNFKIRAKMYNELFELRHPGKKNEFRKKYYWQNPEEARRQAIESRKKNWPEAKIRRRNRLKTDTGYRLAHYIGKRIRKALSRIRKRKCDRTIKLLGCTISEFRTYLEKQWQEGMSWQNYGTGLGKWNIHHKRPIASYDLRDDGQQRAAFHYTNCEPRWSDENSKLSSVWNGKRWLRDDHALPPCNPDKQI